MDRMFDVQWVEGFDIPLVGGGGVKIPWVGVSIYHG